MSNNIYRSLTEKLGGRNLNEYVGKAGELFWDPNASSVRVSDGQTVGGIPINSVESGGYRGYRAVVNRMWGNEATISQLVIFSVPGFTANDDNDNSNDRAPILAYNNSQDTDNDDFHVQGLGQSYNVFVINLYGVDPGFTREGDDIRSPLDLAAIKAFFHAFVENVLYDKDDYAVWGVENYKNNFYNNFDKLKATLPPLYENFRFWATGGTDGWVEVTGGSGNGAAIYVGVNNLGSVYLDGVDSNGTGYKVGDTITFSGNAIYGNTSANWEAPETVTFTVTEVNVDGGITGATSTDKIYIPPYNSIDDGGDDQYDGGNYINARWQGYTDLTEIQYSVSRNADEYYYREGDFSPSSNHTSVYKDSIFGMFIDNAWFDELYFSGGTGVDGVGQKVVDVISGNDVVDFNRTLPQTNIGNSWYNIQPSDMGKHIYGNDYGVNLTWNVSSNLPVGSVFYLVGGQDYNNYLQANDEGVYVRRNNQQGNWYVGVNTIATVLKVDAYNWVIDGGNVWLDD